MASRIRTAFKRERLKKPGKTMQMVGCTVGFLAAHLESQFTDGMTWENYGQWHIDHIKPCISFDLTNPEQIKLCFHWTNLQPLWAIDNLTKNAKESWPLKRAA